MKSALPTSKWSAALIWIAALCAIAPAALAEHPIPESERWATITHPGNAPYEYVNSDNLPVSVGRVDHEFQISRTEVTGAEWFEFVQAYAPYVAEDEWSSATFTSTTIALAGYRQYSLPAANTNRPVEIGWHYAARYVNWLHNGKALTPGAFESGAYDTATFQYQPDGGWTDQVSHSPGATYWIPSVDEWTKAAFFDPDRYGEGMPGYWQYSNTSDSHQRPGSPASGGETSTGGGQSYSLPDVAAYRSVQSPWGLWDCSGGRAEWTENAKFSPAQTGLNGRRLMGTGYSDNYFIGDVLNWDRVDVYRDNTPVGRYGLRVARAVPGATSTGLFVCALSLVSRRRRRFDDTAGGTPQRVSFKGVPRVEPSAARACYAFYRLFAVVQRVETGNTVQPKAAGLWHPRPGVCATKCKGPGTDPWAFLFFCASAHGLPEAGQAVAP